MVTVAHMREAKLCARGARQFAARHNLDFNRFIATGLPASEFEATGDAIALLVAKLARDEAADGERQLGGAA